MKNSMLLVALCVLTVAVALPVTVLAAENSKKPISSDANASATESSGSASATPSHSVTRSSGFSGWGQEVLAPIVRLAGIAIILGLLIGYLELKDVIREQDWTERTVIALAIIFTFCAAALMGASDAMGVLKDVTLVVVGFYFGSGKEQTKGESKTKTTETKQEKDVTTSGSSGTEAESHTE